MLAEDLLEETKQVLPLGLDVGEFRIRVLGYLTVGAGKHRYLRASLGVTIHMQTQHQPRRCCLQRICDINFQNGHECIESVQLIQFVHGDIVPIHAHLCCEIHLTDKVLCHSISLGIALLLELVAPRHATTGLAGGAPSLASVVFHSVQLVDINTELTEKAKRREIDAVGGPGEG